MSAHPEFVVATFLRRLQWGLLALAVGWLVWLLAPVLTPFAVAALLGWMGDPLVDRLERRLPRNTSVILVFAAMTIVGSRTRKPQKMKACIRPGTSRRSSFRCPSTISSSARAWRGGSCRRSFGTARATRP